MAGVRPKKALGQHFLTDMGVARRIASTLDDYRGLPVLEIGPGTGVLTQFLLEQHSPADLVLAEIDSESVAWLKGHLPQPQPRIIEGDFLQMSDTEVFPGDGQFCVIGNYPYNIAQRLAAPEGTRDRGILSVLLQAWYDVEYLFTVSEHVFNPPPKVKSGVIRMRRNNVTDLGVDARLFRTVVKTTFGMRRKTLRNSVKSLLPPGTVADWPDLLNLRPEQLSVGQFIELTKRIEELRKS